MIAILHYLEYLTSGTFTMFDNDKTQDIFMPFISDGYKNLEHQGNRFVHYTSVDNLKNIINSKELWMRESQYMNDYMEVRHGFNELEKYYNKRQKSFDQVIESVFGKEFADRFWHEFQVINHATQGSTYISSISVHKNSEDENGRLSMWRAYGGNTSKAALVMNKPQITIGNSGLIFSPALYYSESEITKDLDKLTKDIEMNSEFLRLQDRFECFSNLIVSLITRGICYKHKGFDEEQEWRFIHMPRWMKEKIIKNTIVVNSKVTISGKSQEVYKIPLTGHTNGTIQSLNLPTLYNNAIIGPCDLTNLSTGHPVKLLEEVAALLLVNKVTDGNNLNVTVSQIPLRKD